MLLFAPETWAAHLNRAVAVANYLVRKSIVGLQAEAEKGDGQSSAAHGGVSLRRSLSALNLMSLGIGDIIGAGIFVLTGHAAAANAGPAITLSFVLAGFACAPELMVSRGIEGNPLLVRNI